MQQKTIINLFRVWAVIAITCFCLMLLHQSRPAIFLGRYSSSYFLSLIIMLITIIMALWGWFLAECDKLSGLLIPSAISARIVAFFCLTFIVFFWIFMPGATFLPAIALFRIYIVMLASGIALFYLYQTQEHQTALTPRTWHFLLIVGIVLAFILTVMFIGRVPESRYYDEPLVANYAWSCAEDGIMGVQMLPPRDLAYLKIAAPLSFCIPGFLMKWFGSNLAVARSFGIISLWLAAPFVYFTAKRLYGSGSAVIATLVMLFFALLHNYLRGDSYVALALSIALYAYIRAKDKPALWLHFIVGFFLATIIEGHQLGVRFIPIFILLYLWQYLGIIREQKRFILYAPFFAFAIGGLSYLPIFYFIHIILWAKTDLPGAIDLVHFAYNEQLTVGGNVNFWQRIAGNLKHWFSLYGVGHPSEVMLLVVGLISAIWRKQSSDRLLLFIFVLSFIIYIYIAPKSTDYYWVHHLPVVALLTAGFSQSLIQDKKTRLVAIFPVLVLIFFFTSQMMLASRRSQSADRVMEISFDIDDNLPPELDVITGHQVYFWGLSGRTFYDSNTYSKLSIPEASEEFNINPPQAVVWTIGLDEHPTIRVHIEEQAMIPVRCYTSNFFGGQTILYVLPEFSETIPEQSCP